RESVRQQNLRALINDFELVRGRHRAGKTVDITHSECPADADAFEIFGFELNLDLAIPVEFRSRLIQRRILKHHLPTLPGRDLLQRRSVDDSYRLLFCERRNSHSLARLQYSWIRRLVRGPGWRHGHLTLQQSHGRGTCVLPYHEGRTQRTNLLFAGDNHEG